VCHFLDCSFLGSKERDETGLDFFQARYFSSVQGRFVSPDDFAGGPTELFAEVAAHNPTFYADIFDPQSLNKYSYCLNNPLIFVDPDGHQSKVSDALAIQSINVGQVGVGVAKTIANIYIGMKNASPFNTDGPTPYYEPSNFYQDWGQTVSEHLLLIGAFLGGRTQANVMVAEAKPSAAVAGEIGAATTARLPQDVAVNPLAPPATSSGRIGTSAAQNAQLQNDIRAANSQGATDIRVNQQQVNARGQRVGVNRPDLQYTRKDGTRVYAEYDRPSGANSSRGRKHADRILANDPHGVVELKVIP
jgi:RHS repeat-associated protein